MAGRAPVDRFAMSPETEARAVLSCAALKTTRRAWMEAAAVAQLERDRHQLKVDRFETAKREAIKNRQSTPAAKDFGLPADYGIPPAFR